ncbi:MAG: hypothetical protein NDJ94_02330 [Vicinamibacteria bacterium]|nr:hypothetical protein [Vicinamibacteria bacterium]
MSHDPLLEQLLPRRNLWFWLSGLPLPFVSFAIFQPPGAGEIPWPLALLTFAGTVGLWAAQRAPAAMIRGFAYAFYSLVLALGFGAGMLKAVVNQWGLVTGPGPFGLTALFGAGAVISGLALLALGALILTEPSLRQSPLVRRRG